MHLTRNGWLHVFVTYFILVHFLPSINNKRRFLSVNETGHHHHAAAASNSTDLRFVAFGTSRTYGSGLGNQRTEQAFPYLLSKDANNLAIRAAGPQYPALCTYSMLGKDAVYDVILLEYNMKANEQLGRLGRRLRDRFPDATIVFLQLWMPFLYYSPSKRRNPKQLLEENKNITKKTYQPFDLYSIANQTDDWIFDDFDTSSRIEAVAKDIGALVYHLPRPRNAQDALRKYGHYFQYDMVHLTKDGHAAVADGLRTFLHDAKRSVRVNEWHDMDACHSWYQSGVTNLHHSAAMTMNHFGKKKFGLEVASSKTSWLTIDNPLQQPADVYMSYMVTAPHQDYPSVSVDLVSSIKDVSSSKTTTKTTTVVPTDKTNRYAVHVVKTALLGTVPTGKSQIQITPLETDRKFPFRITGVTVTTATTTKPASDSVASIGRQ